MCVKQIQITARRDKAQKELLQCKREKYETRADSLPLPHGDSFERLFHLSANNSNGVSLNNTAWHHINRASSSAGD